MNKIKIGSTFSAYLEITNNDIQRPLIIDNNLILEANIYSYKNQLLSNVAVEKVDQTAHPGFILLYVSSEETNKWNSGEAYLNIKIIIGDHVYKSETYKFFIEDDLNGY